MLSFENWNCFMQTVSANSSGLIDAKCHLRCVICFGNVWQLQCQSYSKSRLWSKNSMVLIQCKSSLMNMNIIFSGINNCSTSNFSINYWSSSTVKGTSKKTTCNRSKRCCTVVIYKKSDWSVVQLWQDVVKHRSGARSVGRLTFYGWNTRSKTWWSTK